MHIASVHRVLGVVEAIGGLTDSGEWADAGLDGSYFGGEAGAAGTSVP